MQEDIRFEVGEKYENMKGTFEVIAIHRDQMEIRWENGEEISTSIALQQRIIERMQHEKEMEKEQQAQKKKAKTASAKARKPFAGFEPDDFTLSVSKTNWRARGQLGGMVARKLSSQSFKFNSWAVLRKPETQWLDIDRQKQPDLDGQAKFHARVDDDNLFYGFHLPHLHPSPETSDWNRVMAWLEKPENESWLLKQCSSHSLCLRDLSEQGFAGILDVQEDQWVYHEGDGEPAVVESLGGFLSSAAEAGQLDLRIEANMDKKSAIAKKQAVAADLAALFGSLLPLYAAAANGTA